MSDRPQQDEYMSVRMVAAWLLVHERTVRKWIDAGTLPASRLVQSGEFRIKRADVKKHILGEG